MNALQQLNMDGVELLRVRLDQSFARSAAVPNKTNNNHVVSGHPATVTETTHVTLDAWDVSANPGDEINRFKETIARQPYFKSCMDPSGSVQLVSLSPVQNGLDGKPYMQFTITWDMSQQPLPNQ